MKPRFNLNRVSASGRLLVGALAMMILQQNVHAATYYWDTNGTTAGFGSINGTWGVGNFWNTDSGGGSGTLVTLPTSADDLNLSGGTTGTILISGTGTASSLTFSNNVVTNTNAGILALGGSGTSSGLFVTSAVSSARNVSSIVSLNNAATTIQNAGTGVLTLSGGLTGSQNLILKNNGATAGGITLSGLSLINNTGTITNSGSGNGGVTISAGIGYNVTGITQNSASSSLTLSGVNLFRGDMLVSAGTLVIGNNLALQNSVLDTSGSGVITLSGSTTPTLGGLKGSTNLSSVITTGYTTMSGLTLNVGSGVSNSYTGAIANGSGNTTLTLTGQYGPGTQILAGANTYSGLTTISGGTLQIGNGTTGSLNGTTGTGLTFNTYGGTFRVMEAAGSSQGMGALTFSAGANTVNSTYAGTVGTNVTTLTFSSLAARAAGATGNFEVSGTGITNGVDNKIVLTGVATGFIDRGLYFNGADYAAINSSGNYVRALAYGSDANAAAVDTITASNHVKLTSSPSSRVGDTLLSLNLAGSGVGYTMSSGSLSVPGILKSGGGAQGVISGGTSVTTASNAELVIRTDTASDLLAINTAISGTSGGLTKTGAGTLTLGATNTYTGATTILSGTLAQSATGFIADTSALIINGPTAVFDLGNNKSDTVAGITLAGGGRITGTGTSTLTGGTLTLQNGLISGNVSGSTLQKSTNGTVTITSNVSTSGGNSAITGGALVITGPNASWNNGGQFQIGSTNANNTGSSLTISNGAGMAVGGSWWTNGGSGNPINNAPGTVITVTGAGSNLNLVSQTGDIGDRGSSAFNVLNGGAVNMAAVYIAYYGTSTGMTVTVDGAGSYLRTAGLGGFSPAGSGYLFTVSNGGTWNNRGANWAIQQSNNGFAIGTGGTALSTVIANQISFNNATDYISFNNGQFMASATGTIISGIGAVTLNGAAYVNSNTYTATISSAISGAGALNKIGAGQLTLSSASNTYTGGTNVNGGTLLLSGAISTPSSGTLSVGSGGTFSLADGTARTTTVPALSLAGGAALQFDWNASATDRLNSTAAVSSTGGNVGIIISPTSPNNTSAPYTLLSASSGLQSNSTNYFLANNTNYTATLTQSDSAVTIGSYSAVSALTGTVYWYGGQVTGALGSMNYSTGTVSNWSTSATYAATALIPTAINAVFSTTTGATNQSNVTLDADMSLGTITFNDSNAVTIGGSHILTLTGTGTGASSALSVGTGSATTTTINASLALGAATTTWTVASGKTLQVNGIVGGPNNLSLASGGSSNVILTGANTYYGTTTIGSGVNLQIGGGSSTGALSPLSGITNNGTLTFNRTNAVTQGVDFAIGASASTSYGAAAISGSGGVTQAGSGTLFMIGVNSYTGATTINNGVLNASNFAAIGSNSPIGAGIATNNTTNAASLVINGGTLQYTGSTVASTNRLFTIGTSGATLDASGTGAGTLTLGSAGGNIAFSSSSAPATLGLTGTGSGILAAVLGDSGSGANVTNLTKTGTGNWTLTGANTYSGGTIVNAGEVTATGSSALGATTGTLAVNNQNTGAGNAVVLNLSTTAATTTGSLSGTIANSGSGINTATINNGGQLFTVNQIVDATFAGEISGTGGFTLGSLSTSKLTLTGTNTYSGNTTVNAGILLVNGAITGNGNVSVGASATVGGTGSISGNMSVSGILSPGASIESLVTGAVTMNSGSTFVFEAADTGSTGADLLAVDGTLSLSGVTLDLSGASLSAGTWLAGDKLTLISYKGTAITSGFTGYSDDQNYLFGSNSWTIDYNDIVKGNNFSSQATGLQFVTLTLVPEPSSIMLGAVGLMLACRRRR